MIILKEIGFVRTNQLIILLLLRHLHLKIGWNISKNFKNSKQYHMGGGGEVLDLLVDSLAAGILPIERF